MTNHKPDLHTTIQDIDIDNCVNTLTDITTTKTIDDKVQSKTLKPNAGQLDTIL